MKLVTRLDPRAISYGKRLGISSAALGEPLIPWQAEAAQLINAVDPDDPTRWRYNLVIITVPRQCGKTTLIRAVNLDRLISPLPNGRPRQPTTLWMTAQLGKDARRRWSDLAERIAAAPAVKHLITRRQSVGSEALRLGNVALSPFAPTPEALHGETTPLVSIDEAWAFDEPGAAALMAAVGPTMQNVPGSQLIIFSTAGTHESRWLWSLVKAGRASLTDPHSRIAFIEHAADPAYALDGDDGLDPYSADALDFHPGIAGGITSISDVQGLYAQAGGIANVRRGFLNLWPADMDTLATITRDLDAFDRAATAGAHLAPPGQAVYAYDVARDRSGAAIYAATKTATGRHIELVESDAGASWLRDHTTREMWHDPDGYAGNAALALPRAKPVAVGDLADATADFLAGIADGTITLNAGPELRDQYEHAATRTAGGGFTFDVVKSPGPIDHLRAAALAGYKLRTAPALPTIAWA